MAGFGHKHDNKNNNIQRRQQRIGEAYYEKAIDHHVRGDLSTAEISYRKAINCGVSNAAIFSNLGLICQATQRTEEAIRYYKKAISINQNEPEPYTNLGSLYQQLGNLNQALDSTLKSLELNPDNSTAHMNLGIIYKDLGNIDQALDSLIKSLELNPDNSTAHMNLGGIYKDLGKLDQALASTLKSLELYPDSPTAHMNLGGIYKDLGNLDQALASLIKSLELNPDNPNAHMNLGSIYDSLENPHRAVASTLKSLELKPDNHTALTNLGSFYLKLKNQDQALKSILKSLEINSTNSDALFILSNIKLQLGELQEAQASITKAIYINPDKALYRIFLGLILCAKGDMKQAIESQKTTLHSRTLSKEDQFYAFALSSSIHTLKEEENPTRTSTKSIKFPITLQRTVEPKLIESLYALNSIDLNNVADPTFGKAKGSTYNFFKDHGKQFQYLEKELLTLIKSALSSEIYIHDSFYTILNGDSVVKRHNHLTDLDKIKDLGMGKKKFALVYYVETGDQECSEPGILKFYEPEKELLPSKGMVIIFPGELDHSATYNGKKDRIIIGINFYTKDIPAIKSEELSNN